MRKDLDDDALDGRSDHAPPELIAGQLLLRLADADRHPGEVLLVLGLLGLEHVLPVLELEDFQLRVGVGVGHLLAGLHGLLEAELVDLGGHFGVAHVDVVAPLLLGHLQPRDRRLFVGPLDRVVDLGENRVDRHVVALLDVHAADHAALLRRQIGRDVRVVDERDDAVPQQSRIVGRRRLHVLRAEGGQRRGKYNRG